MNYYIATLLFLTITASVVAQEPETTTYSWPMQPFNQQVRITGTFGEYRSTSANGHFHNAVDIPAPAGTPVYAVIGGRVAVAYHDGSTGYDSYVRVESEVNGQTKSITYYHCVPTTAAGQIVSAGQQIAEIAIDHVHLIEYRAGAGLSGAHVNPIRPDGGLVPYSDNWAPVIHYVKFLIEGTETELPADALSGNIDIITHIGDVNGSGSSAGNNGTYIAGYKILSVDRSEVVYSPLDDGVRYKYYNLPINSYVNNAYYRPESSTSKHVNNLTNGLGAANVNTSKAVPDNTLDIDMLERGDYTLMVFSEDTRGNADTVYVPITTRDIDFVAPEAPSMAQLSTAEEGKIKLAWNEPADDDILGYRVDYSFTGFAYQQRNNESELNAGFTEMVYDFPLTEPLYLRMYAVDTSPVVNVSYPSKAYGVRTVNEEQSILIVEGFDRYGNGGALNVPSHEAVVSHAQTLEYNFESVHRSQIDDGVFSLEDYDAVIWITGDNDTTFGTLSETSMELLKTYLESGGNLLISGANIAFDLAASEAATEESAAFVRDYLKAGYVADDSFIPGAIGVEGTPFEEFYSFIGQTQEGSPYNVRSLDVIEPLDGSEAVLSYDERAVAAVAYRGAFGSSTTTGSVVYLAFPFDAVGGLAQRTILMDAAVSYFGFDPTSVEDHDAVLPAAYALGQNYPNPFNPSTTITFSIPAASDVTLKVYDMLGREVAVLANGALPAGTHEVEFAAGAGNSLFSSGIYFYTLNANEFSATRKMLLLK